MRTRKLIISLLAAAAALTACTNEDNAVGTQQPTVGAEARTYTVSIPATIGGDEAQTRAVTFGGTDDAPTAIGRFETTEKIYVFNETQDKMLSGVLQPAHISSDGKHCQLEGELTGNVKAGDKLTLLYNLNKHGIGRVDCYFEYLEQDGSQAGVIDGGMAENLTAVSLEGEGQLTTQEKASFKMQQAMLRLKFTEGTSPITVRKLIISSDENGIAEFFWPLKTSSTSSSSGSITVTPAVATSDYLYVALHDIEGSDLTSLTFTVTDSEGRVYTGSKAAPAGGFTNGNYYYSTAATYLAFKTQLVEPTITWTRVKDGAAVEPIGYNNCYEVYGPSNGSGYDHSEIAISGTSLGYRFWFWATNGATIHLRDVNATFDLTNPFIHISGGNLNLDISDANTITCKNYSWGIHVEENLKLSGNGTLTVTAKDASHKGLYASRNYKDNKSDPSVIAADGHTVVCSDATDNGDGTYTWTYTVTNTVETKLAEVTQLEAANGAILTGKLGGAEASNTGNVKIAAGATVTLRDVDITNVADDNGNRMAGIECLGDATIILSGSNKVKSGSIYKPAILVPYGHKLTIKGNGALEATVTGNGAGNGAGIGGGYDDDCGDIEILSGDVTAKGNAYSAGIGGGDGHSCGTITITGGTVTATGDFGAGIGSGYKGSCGDITITGGTVTATGGNGAGIGSGSGDSGSCGDITIKGGTVKATGGFGAGIGSGDNGSCNGITIKGGTVTAKGDDGAGIGSGHSGSCGDITITDGVSSVTASKGAAACSIGRGNGGRCGIVTIGVTEYYDGNNFLNGGVTYLTTSPLVYKPEEGNRE